MNALEKIGNGLIRKADTSHKSAKILKAMAITRATQTPAGAKLARRVLQLHRQQVIRKQFGYSEPAPQEDEWSSMFSKADDDEANEDELRAELRELQDREREITERIRELHF
jgi:hypothetical protein